MTLVNYFYKKFVLSFLICLGSSLTIFYIFSLLGNLGEKHAFSLILYLSLLNAFQIISYVPSLIIILTIVLLVIFFRSKNELIIFKEYLSVKVIILVFLPISIIFSAFTVNKDIIIDGIENKKLDLFNSNNNQKVKLVISENKEFKSFTILKDLDLINSSVSKYQKYYSDKDSIISGEFSNYIDLKDNKLVAKEYTLFKDNSFQNISQEKIILPSIENLIGDKFITKTRVDKKLFNLNFKSTNGIIFFVIFYISIFLILFSKNIVDRKANFFIPVMYSLLLLVYSLIIFNIDIKLFNKEMYIFATLFILLSFYKFYKYE